MTALYQAHFHEVKIPLIIGMTMSGFGLRMKPSEGVHDNPMIKCLTLDDGKKKIMFVHCDLLGYSAGRCAEVKELAAKRCGLCPDDVFISCTHTHSGPTSITLIGTGDEREDWHALMRDALCDALCEAYSAEGRSVTPELYKGVYKEGSMNRVTRGAGMTDTDVFSLVLRETDDRIYTVLTNYACHAVTTREENYLYSRDYPYYAELEIKRALGENANFIFANGCCGDINPVNGCMSGFEATEEMGRALGSAVISSIREENRVNADFGSISVMISPVYIPIARRDSHEELEALRERTKKLIENATNPDLKTFFPSYIAYADRMEKARLEGKDENGFDTSVKRVSLGDVNIVLIPFETFHGIGKNIKKLLGSDRTMVFELGDGNYGYMASDDLYEKSSYEVNYAHYGYAHPGPAAKGAEEIVLNTLAK